MVHLAAYASDWLRAIAARIAEEAG